MLNKEEYFEYYHNYGRCVDQMQPPRNRLTVKRLESKYNNYYKKEMRKLDKPEKDYKEWDRVRDYVFRRDGYRCRLYSILSPNEKAIFKQSGSYLHKELDPAHVVPRSISKRLYCDTDNIVTLNRTFHSRLDTQCDPLTGIPISVDIAKSWWIRLIGVDLFYSLWERK